MGARRDGRETAVQVLYQMDAAASTAEDALRVFFAHFDGDQGISADARAFAEQLVRGVSEHQTEIDTCLRDCSQHWRLERMPRVDRNILRLAAYELMCVEDIPKNIVLDEAIELAKRFGTEESASFVNGVLDHVAHRVRS